MNPTGFDELLFRGIPRAPHRRSARFFSSLCIHVVGLALLLALAPQIVISGRAPRFNTTLIAPAEPPAPPKPVPAAVVVEKSPAPKPAPVLRPVPRIHEARVVIPKLEEAPRLPNAPRPAAILPPVPVAAIRPPVQTGVFGSNLPPQESPKLPVPAALDAGFDQAAVEATAAPSNAIVSAGFDARSNVSRPAVAAKVQTGAFGIAAEPASARLVAANVNHAGFDVVPEAEKRAAPEQIRKSGFDQQKAVSAPVKQAAPAVVPVRPIEILDKPKPVYTAEARAQKIEGTVLLDVIFTAGGEVRVLGVVRGLGHGLDENAVDAARHIHFIPAVQSGRSVDQHVTLRVVFQITG